jgi:hypothetical protein
MEDARRGTLASHAVEVPDEHHGAAGLHGAERLPECAGTADLDDEIDAAGAVGDRLPPLRIAAVVDPVLGAEPHGASDPPVVRARDERARAAQSSEL